MSEKGFRAAIVRNDIARGIIGGFSTVTPLLSGVWRFLDHALADISAVLAELEAVRLDRANLLAAMSATLGAWSDGEDDPLWYIRDELEARRTPSPDEGDEGRRHE
jgi:hypothetical protein